MDLVSATEAARQLGVHPSQITRGIQNGLIPNHAPPGLGRPLVSVAEAREGRKLGLDRSKQRGPQSPLFAAEPTAATIAAVPAVAETPVPAPAATWDTTPADEDTRDPSYQTSRARRESAAAAKAEIELAQIRGRTLDRTEVADAAFRVGQMLREDMERRRVALAQRLAGLDVPAMIGVLADVDEAHLTALADAVARDLVSEEARVAA